MSSPLTVPHRSCAHAVSTLDLPGNGSGAERRPERRSGLTASGDLPTVEKGRGRQEYEEGATESADREAIGDAEDYQSDSSVDTRAFSLM